MGFDKTAIAVRTGDGRNVTLLESLTFTSRNGQTITVPVGATCDGASTPAVLWATLPPFGVYWLAAVLHDYLYRETELSKVTCDMLLLEAMESLGVSKVQREIIYEGVRVGGSHAFDVDRRAKP